MQQAQWQLPVLSAWQFEQEQPAQRFTPSSGVFLPTDCWIHLDYQHPDVARVLTQSAVLHPDVVHALIVRETRPRLMPLAGGFLLYLRGVNLNPGAAPDDMVAIRLWFDVANRRIVSTQRRQLKSLSEIQAALAQGRGPDSCQQLLVELIERLNEHLESVVDELESRAESFGALGQLQVGTAAIESLAQLRRQTLSLKRYLHPQREAYLKISQEPLLLGDDEHLRHRARETVDRSQRLLEDLDLLREHAAIAREDLQSRLSDRLERRMYVLAVITAIFLPLSFITGLFGVNLGGIPGTDDSRAFTLFSVAIFLFSLALLGLLKRRSWL